MNAALSTGEKEQIAVIVPADLIHFKLELFLGTRLVCLDINKRHKVFFVANCDRLTIRRPTHVDVLSYNNRFTSSSVIIIINLSSSINSQQVTTYNFSTK